jgi:hypothetical protein
MWGTKAAQVELDRNQCKPLPRNRGQNLLQERQGFVPDPGTYNRPYSA